MIFTAWSFNIYYLLPYIKLLITVSFAFFVVYMMIMYKQFKTERKRCDSDMKTNKNF